MGGGSSALARRLTSITQSEIPGFVRLNFLSLSVLAELFATLAGALLALWLRYNGPDPSLSFAIMIDILLIVVIGGMGTMYGAVIGSTLSSGSLSCRMR